MTLEIVQSDDGVYHLVLSLGDPGEDVLTRHFRQLGEQIYQNRRALAPLRQRPETSVPFSEGSPQKITIKELRDLINTASDVVALTGAGMSSGSGIPTFVGSGSVSEHFRLNEPFPGEAPDWMIGRPSELVDILVRFEEALRSSAPSVAHKALVELEQLGIVSATLTSNYDRLHERAGSINTHLIDPAYGAAGIWAPLAKHGVLLLVIGVSGDEYRVIGAARRAGVSIVGCNVDLPAYLCEEDRLVVAPADTTLTNLVREFSFKRNDSRPVGAHRFVSITDDDWFRKLLLAIEEGCPGTRIAHHGPEHWRRVAWIGLDLASGSNDIDPAVVMLFGMLHDSMRVRDDADPLHGPRAASLADLWRGSLLPTLSYTQSRLLSLALAHHTEGLITRNPTVGACWDADRLDLWRVGVAPDARLLSTEGAKASPLASAPGRRTVPTWDVIWATFLRIMASKEIENEEFSQYGAADTF